MSIRMCIEAEHWLSQDPARRVTIQYGVSSGASNVRFTVRTGRHLVVTNPDSEVDAPRWVSVAAVTSIIGVQPREEEL